MTDAFTASTHLGINPGATVRLLANSPDFEQVLSPLPEGVTVSTLGSEAAEVGIIVVDDVADLRARLSTELGGLIGAKHVWIITRTGTGTGPDSDAIHTALEGVSWVASSSVALDAAWTATELQKT